MTYNTEKRAEILSLLKGAHDTAFTVEEICARVCEGGSGKSTVYRIISHLVADGTVKKLTDARTRHTTYQYIGGDECHEHLHLKCEECGRLIHLDCETSHQLKSRIMAVGSFELNSLSLLFGRCESCIKNEIKEERKAQI